MSEHTIIPDALKYYDAIYEKYKPIFDKITSNERVIHNSDMERNVIKCFDDNKELVFESRYEVVGIYSYIQKVWCWAWSIPFFSKNNTYISRKMLYYGLDSEEKFIKMRLTTSRFTVSDKIELDIHVAIAAYLTKKVIFRFKEQNITYYLFLLDIDSDKDMISKIHTTST